MVVLVSDLADAYAVDGEHQLAFDDVFRSAEAFGVLYYGHAVCGVIDEVGIVGALFFQELTVRGALGGNKDVFHLFAEVGDQPCALHQLQLVGAAVLLGGVVAAGPVRTVFVALL